MTGMGRTQDVLVPHQHGLVDLGLSGPAGLVGGEEDFDGDLFAPPLSHPHLSVAALADLLHHLDLFGYCPLYLRRNEGFVCVNLKGFTLQTTESYTLNLCFHGNLKHSMCRTPASCSVRVSPTEGAPSLSRSFGTVRSGPSKTLQAGCSSHPAPARYCTEDGTPDICTFKKNATGRRRINANQCKYIIVYTHIHSIHSYTH